MEKKTVSIILIGLFVFSFLAFFSFSNFKTPSMTGFTIFTAQPDSTTGKDTYLRESIPNNNYSTQTTLQVGKIAAGTEYRSIVEFNISEISSENTVTNGTLQIYSTSATNTEDITIKAYRITSEWNETTANWNNRLAASIWSSAGGDIGEEVASITVNTTAGIYYNFSITSLVKKWVNGTHENYGILLLSSDAGAGNYTTFASSNSETEAQRPKIIIDHTTNAIPTITNISSDTNATNFAQVGEQITFTTFWADEESDNAQMFVCNTSNITTSGCVDTTLCSTSSASTNPVTCSYTVLSSDNRTTNYSIAMCDEYNCSIVNNDTFYMNHAPTALVTQPNGGETVNQTQGNYFILFSVTDSDADALNASLYYGATQNSTTNTINASINLTDYCTDADSTTSTTNTCNYSWNSLGIYGTYFLTIILNDSYITSNDSSDASFDVRSIIDTENPNVTSPTIESYIYSGKTTQINVTVEDDNPNTVWILFNYTSTNSTMTNSTATLYSGTFVAPVVGTYSYKVYANDSVTNLNNSMEWQEFTVTKPNATTQNETAPSTALPYHLVKITTQLNATDALRNVSAYLTVPSGFTFLSGYPQNNIIGNFSTNNVSTATWFVSTPITESNYTLNVTYTDFYSNTWNSSDFYITTTSAIGGYEISMTGSPEIAASESYYAEAYFKQSGSYIAPDSMKIILYDSAGNTQSSGAMTNEQTGIYNYTYAVGAAPMAGIWETIVNATKSGTSYYAHEFWKVVGALFDVRDIEIIDAVIEDLNISVILENIGNNPTDLVLNWNLTRSDTSALLDSGQDTIGVGATPITAYVTPSTTYVGQVQITFVGTYLDTEQAGAYKIFSTTSTAVSCGDGTCNGAETCSTCATDCGACSSETPSSGGGGGGGTTPAVTTEYDFTIETDETIYLTKNIEKKIYLTISNSQDTKLTNISLEIQGIEESQYSITSSSIESLEKGEEKEFEITFNVDLFGEKNIIYILTSDQITKTKTVKMIVLNAYEFFLQEILRLTDKINELKEKIKSKGKEKILPDLENCENILEEVKSNLEKQEFINIQGNIQRTDDCLNDIENKLEKKFFEFKMDNYWIWLIALAVLIFGIALIYIIYLLSKKTGVVNFVKDQQAVSPPQEENKKAYINETIKNIEKKLE